MTIKEVTSDWQWAWINYGSREKKYSWQEVFKDPSSDKFFVVSAVEKYGFKPDASIYIPESLVFPYDPKPDFEFGDPIGNINSISFTTTETSSAKIDGHVSNSNYCSVERTEVELNYTDLIISHIPFPMDQYACVCGLTALDPITKNNTCSSCHRYEWTPWKYAGLKIGDTLSGDLRDELLANLEDNYHEQY